MPSSVPYYDENELHRSGRHKAASLRASLNTLWNAVSPAISADAHYVPALYGDDAVAESTEDELKSQHNVRAFLQAADTQTTIQDESSGFNTTSMILSEEQDAELAERAMSKLLAEKRNHTYRASRMSETHNVKRETIPDHMLDPILTSPLTASPSRKRRRFNELKAASSSMSNGGPLIPSSQSKIAYPELLITNYTLASPHPYKPSRRRTPHAALFRQQPPPFPTAISPTASTSPSARNHPRRTPTRPTVAKLFASLCMPQPAFLRLQAAAKAFMLDPAYPARANCIGSRGRADSEHIRASLYACARTFLASQCWDAGRRGTDSNDEGESAGESESDAGGSEDRADDGSGEDDGNSTFYVKSAKTIGEAFFGASAGGAEARAAVWPADADAVAKLVMPVLRRVLTNEWQRQYARETRKPGPGAGNGARPSDEEIWQQAQQQAQQQKQEQEQEQVAPEAEGQADDDDSDSNVLHDNHDAYHAKPTRKVARKSQTQRAPRHLRPTKPVALPLTTPPLTAPASPTTTTSPVTPPPASPLQVTLHVLDASQQPVRPRASIPAAAVRSWAALHSWIAACVHGIDGFVDRDDVGPAGLLLLLPPPPLSSPPPRVRVLLGDGLRGVERAEEWEAALAAVAAAVWLEGVARVVVVLGESGAAE